MKASSIEGWVSRKDTKNTEKYAHKLYYCPINQNNSPSIFL
jgi:hypothetical protein